MQCVVWRPVTSHSLYCTPPSSLDSESVTNLNFVVTILHEDILACRIIFILVRTDR